MKSIVILFLCCTVIFADAIIKVDGDVEYTIDGKKSTSSVIKGGETIAYTQGSGTLKIKENDTNKEYILEKGQYKKIDSDKKSIFTTGKGFVFKKTSDSNVSVMASTKGYKKCIEISQKDLQIEYTDSIKYIDHNRNHNTLERYEINAGVIKLTENNSKSNIEVGDQIILRDSDESAIGFYCIVK